MYDAMCDWYLYISCGSIIAAVWVVYLATRNK